MDTHSTLMGARLRYFLFSFEFIHCSSQPASCTKAKRGAKFCCGRYMLGGLYPQYTVVILSIMDLSCLHGIRERQATSGKLTRRIKKGFPIGLVRLKAPFQRIPPPTIWQRFFTTYLATIQGAHQSRDSAFFPTT